MKTLLLLTMLALSIKSQAVELSTPNSRGVVTVVATAGATWSDSPSIYLQANDISGAKRVYMYINRATSVATIYYYNQHGQPVATTDNSENNPYENASELFSAIQSKLVSASKSCPIILEFDRAVMEKGLIKLKSVRATCDQLSK